MWHSVGALTARCAHPTLRDGVGGQHVAVPPRLHPLRRGQHAGCRGRSAAPSSGRAAPRHANACSTAPAAHQPWPGAGAPGRASAVGSSSSTTCRTFWRGSQILRQRPCQVVRARSPPDSVLTRAQQAARHPAAMVFGTRRASWRCGAAGETAPIPHLLHREVKRHRRLLWQHRARWRAKSSALNAEAPCPPGARCPSAARAGPPAWTTRSTCPRHGPQDGGEHAPRKLRVHRGHSAALAPPRHLVAHQKVDARPCSHLAPELRSMAKNSGTPMRRLTPRGSSAVAPRYAPPVGQPDQHAPEAPSQQHHAVIRPRHQAHPVRRHQANKPMMRWCGHSAHRQRRDQPGQALWCAPPHAQHAPAPRPRRCGIEGARQRQSRAATATTR